MDGGALLGVNLPGEFILGTIEDEEGPTPRPFTISAVISGTVVAAALSAATASASISGATISAEVTVSEEA